MSASQYLQARLQALITLIMTVKLRLLVFLLCTPATLTLPWVVIYSTPLALLLYSTGRGAALLRVVLLGYGYRVFKRV